jgi:hypothetical protein
MHEGMLRFLKWCLYYVFDKEDAGFVGIIVHNMADKGAMWNGISIGKQRCRSSIMMLIYVEVDKRKHKWRCTSRGS